MQEEESQEEEVPGDPEYSEYHPLWHVREFYRRGLPGEEEGGKKEKEYVLVRLPMNREHFRAVDTWLAQTRFLNAIQPAEQTIKATKQAAGVRARSSGPRTSVLAAEKAENARVDGVSVNRLAAVLAAMWVWGAPLGRDELTDFLEVVLEVYLDYRSVAPAVSALDQLGLVQHSGVHTYSALEGMCQAMVVASQRPSYWVKLFDYPGTFTVDRGMVNQVRLELGKLAQRAGKAKIAAFGRGEDTRLIGETYNALDLAVRAVNAEEERRLREVVKGLTTAHAFHGRPTTDALIALLDAILGKGTRLQITEKDTAHLKLRTQELLRLISARRPEVGASFGLPHLGPVPFDPPEPFGFDTE